MISINKDLKKSPSSGRFLAGFSEVFHRDFWENSIGIYKRIPEEFPKESQEFARKKVK